MPVPEPIAEDAPESGESAAEGAEEPAVEDAETPSAPPEEPPPPTDDPDAPKPRRIKRPSQRLARASTRVEHAERKDHGLVPFVLSFLLVVGGWFGAKAATAPDPQSKARLELARAHLAMTKEHDYKKAQEA